MKDLSNQLLTSHIKKKPVTKSKVFNSGSGNASSQKLELKKVQSSDINYSANPVRHLLQPLASPLSTKALREVCRLIQCAPDATTDDLKGCQPFSKSSVKHSPVASCRDSQHKHSLTRENKNKAGDLKISKKRKKGTNNGKPNKRSCVHRDGSPSSHTPRSLLEFSAVSAISPKPPESCQHAKPLPGEITHLESLSVSNSCQTTCSVVSFYSSVETRPPMGAKQVFIKSAVNPIVTITESLREDQHPQCSKKNGEEVYTAAKAETSSPSAGARGDAAASAPLQSCIQTSAQGRSISSELSAKTSSRNTQTEVSRRLRSSHKSSRPRSSSLNSCSAGVNKSGRKRRPVAVLDSDDINSLFTPELTTFLIVDGQKLVMSPVGKEMSKPSVKDKTMASVRSPSTTGSLCLQPEEVTHAAGRKVWPSPPEPKVKILLPTLCLERIKMNSKGSKLLHSPSIRLKNSPAEVATSPKRLQDSGVKSNRKQSLLRPDTLETQLSAPHRKSSSSQSFSPPKRRANKKQRKQVTDQVASDVELDLDLNLSLDLDLIQSSHSGAEEEEEEEEEEEQLMSLQDLMKLPAHHGPDTLEKDAAAEARSPGHQSSKVNTQPSSKPLGYKHNLDTMIKEKNIDNRYYEIKTQLLDTCQDDLLKIAEYEKAEESQEEAISNEHQEFLQHYMLVPTAIKEVPPGEVVFNLEKFGCIFDYDTLQLKECMTTSPGAVQKILLMSSQAQLKLHLNVGMFTVVYNSDPCPAEVTQFLFKMMSVHNERTFSQKIFQSLHDIACTAACHIVRNGDEQFKVWVPSLADMALVLMNMGAAFVSLFPFENLQPPFTEGDLLGEASLNSESCSKSKQRNFPEANYNNVLKYLGLCLTLCPRAYSDDELLLLLTVLGKVSLDSNLILQTGMELDSLLCRIFYNIKEWDAMLPRICRALVNLTDDHHNMCLLVRLLPHNKCGTLLRRQLCLSMISKLLDGRCTYTPTDDMLTLSELRLYLPRMQPSSLLHTIVNSGRGNQSNLDEQAYYLCYSLLTLVKEASNFPSCPPEQRDELLCLCSQLETHVKCHIRESEKCLYRTRVKDLVARIDIKWQILLYGTKPLDNQIYHYWKPPPADVLQEELDALSSDSEDEGNKQDTDGPEDAEAAMESEDEETEDVKSKIDAGSKTVAYLNQGGERVGENIIDELHESKMTEVDCGLEMRDATVILRRLQEKHEERRLDTASDCGD